MTAGEWFTYLKANAHRAGIELRWSDTMLQWFSEITASDPELAGDTSAAWATLDELQDMDGGEDFGMDVAFIRGEAP